MSVPYSNSYSLSRHRNRKYSKEHLLRNLKILGDLSAPLSPDLPPSPPPSPRPAPSSLLKRKPDRSINTEPTKRHRLESSDTHTHRTASADPPQPPPLPPHLTPAVSFPSRLSRSEKPEPSEDGEVREDSIYTSAPSSSAPARWPSAPAAGSIPVAAPQFAPIRRPRRGRLSTVSLDEMHDRYHQWGRMLKYSGDARFWSSYPSTHKEYRPLADPPPLNSPYHRSGGLISRLELLDALVCFAYSIWCRDVSRRFCSKETWATIEAFLFWCKGKWTVDDSVSEREKVFAGLIWMIEAFINARKVYFTSHHQVEPKIEQLVTKCQHDIASAMTSAESGADGSGLTTSSVHGKNPQMLPSPASIAPPTSANSTPTSRPNGTPNTTGSGSGMGASPAAPAASGSGSSAPPRPAPHMAPGNLGRDAHPNLPIPIAFFPTNSSGVPCIPEPGSAAFTAASKVNATLPPSMLWTLNNLAATISATAYCIDRSALTLTLPLLARHFPVTFARMMYSSLQAGEEHEPDMEDTEGELFWPGNMGSGQGLGWVCLMGRAMIREFGGEIGYKGLDGVVPKPKLEEGQGPSAGSAMR